MLSIEFFRWRGSNNIISISMLYHTYTFIHGKIFCFFFYSGLCLIHHLPKPIYYYHHDYVLVNQPLSNICFQYMHYHHLYVSFMSVSMCIISFFQHQFRFFSYIICTQKKKWLEKSRERLHNYATDPHHTSLFVTLPVLVLLLLFSTDIPNRTESRKRVKPHHISLPISLLLTDYLYYNIIHATHPYRDDTAITTLTTKIVYIQKFKEQKNAILTKKYTKSATFTSR